MPVSSRADRTKLNQKAAETVALLSDAKLQIAANLDREGRKLQRAFPTASLEQSRRAFAKALRDERNRRFGWNESSLNNLELRAGEIRTGRPNFGMILLPVERAFMDALADGPKALTLDAELQAQIEVYLAEAGPGYNGTHTGVLRELLRQAMKRAMRQNA